MLYKYEVELMDSSNGCTYYFECMAEDKNHAAEQAQDAYPDDDIMWIDEII